MHSKDQAHQVIPDPPEPLDWKEAARLYVDEGLTYAEVARRMGHHRQSIRASLLAHRVPRHRRSLASSGPGEKLYGIWKGMKRKCRRAGSPSYNHYGAKGIDYCSEWEKFETFHRWAMESGYKLGMSLALEEGAKLFSPQACRWASPEEKVQLRLRLAPSRPRRVITAFGETKGAAEWARDPRCQVGLAALCQRLDAGYSPEDAITLSGEVTQNAASRNQLQRRKTTRRRPAATRICWEEAERLHVKEGHSCPQIAKLLGASSSAVWIGLKRRGVYRPRQRKLSNSKLGKPLHAIWRAMHEHCSDPNHAAYGYYGAKGVRVCEEWTEFEPFYAWARESGYRRGLCLSRMDRDVEYSPTNCTWITRAEAAQHADHPPRQARPRWTIVAFGEKKGPTAWSRDPRCAVRLKTVLKRLRSGMDPEEAITLPPQKPGGVSRTVLVSAFGKTKNLTEWSLDPRCRVTIVSLHYRLRRGVPPEAAITTPPFRLHVGKPLRKPSRRKRA